MAVNKSRLKAIEAKVKPPAVWTNKISYDPETEIGIVHTLKNGKVVDTLCVKGFDLREP